MAALSGILRIWGWKVQPVATVADALTALDRRLDVAILDLMLPDGDGTAVMQYIRQAGLATRVIVTTGAHDATLLDAVRQLAPAAILTKPIDLARLQGLLDLVP